MIAAKIRDTFLSVPLIADNCQVWAEERFPESDADDEEVSTVPKYGSRNTLRMTSIIQVGLPSVEEIPWTSETCTQLTFVYPITFDLAVEDRYDDSDSGSPLAYKSSRALFMAIYMLGRRAFKETIDLGFENCQHFYLQQENGDTVEDEETGGNLQVGDWSLKVVVKGITV